MSCLECTKGQHIALRQLDLHLEEAHGAARREGQGPKASPHLAGEGEASSRAVGRADGWQWRIQLVAFHCAMEAASLGSGGFPTCSQGLLPLNYPGSAAKLPWVYR